MGSSSKSKMLGYQLLKMERFVKVTSFYCNGVTAHEDVFPRVPSLKPVTDVRI